MSFKLGSYIPPEYVEVAYNAVTKPSFETSSERQAVFYNLMTNPVGTVHAGSTVTWQLIAQGAGQGGSSVTSTVTEPQVLPGNIEVPSFRRKTWTVVPTAGLAIGWQFGQAPDSNRSPVVGGRSLRLLYHWRTSLPALTTSELRFEFWNAASGGNRVGETVMLQGGRPPFGGWMTEDVTITVPAGATHVYVYHYMVANVANIQVGSTMDATGVLVSQDYLAGPFWYGGGASPDPDLTPHYAGAMGASSSYLAGDVATATSTVFACIRSRRWAVDREFSARVIPRNNSTDNFVLVHTTTAGSVYLPLGKWIAVSVTCHLDKAQTGTLYSRARNITVTSSAGTSLPTPTSQAPNVPGDHRLTLIYYIPQDVQWAMLRLYNGASLGNGETQWDGLVCSSFDTEAEAHAYLAWLDTLPTGYFDGYSTPSSVLQRTRWEGTPDSSPSVWEQAVGTGTSTFDTNDIPGFKAILDQWPVLPTELQVSNLPAGEGSLYYRSRMGSTEWVFNLELTGYSLRDVLAKADQISAELNPKMKGLQDFVPNAMQPWVWQGVLAEPISWDRDDVLWFSDKGICRLHGRAVIATPDPYGYTEGEPVVRTTAGDLVLSGEGNTSYYPVVEFRGILSAAQTLTVAGCVLQGPLTDAQEFVLDFGTMEFYIRNRTTLVKVRNVADRFTAFTRLEGSETLNVPVNISGGTFTHTIGRVRSRRI